MSQISTDVSQPHRTPKGSAANGQRLAGSTSTDSINSGLNTQTQVPAPLAKPIDRQTITGSTPGNFNKSGDTAKAAMDQIANPPAPREQMRGQQNSRNYNEQGKGFQSTSDSSDSDAGN